MFAPEIIDTTDAIGSVSNLGVSGVGAWALYKVVRLCETAKAYLEAQTQALAVLTGAAEAVEAHVSRTEKHQHRVEEILSSAA